MTAYRLKNGGGGYFKRQHSLFSSEEFVEEKLRVEREVSFVVGNIIYVPLGCNILETQNIA